MAQILDPLPSNNQDRIICCYVNVTSQIQVARITNIPNWYFERVVFPGQRLVFESLPDALLEIHTGMMATAILSDRIPCCRLCIDQKNNSSEQPLDSKQMEKPTANKQNLGAVNNKNIITSETLKYATLS
ncbi:MAG: DUF1830 domain-containing protein [Symploca sp. SIO3C6]|uniref:DUF1830 domain-containing protein n=1 Tax=Symploca sp. SIO1C4 TaxID=2607765 RepID=A0A6B3NKU0_9CYAN|nr:DUF1830 domain-containing protein [Symploca sp. SIO3C6]NER32187.1 DUF1830 domain-containing protein [Symploca sp. SIO1C4]NET04986.1 DUF1830 domain-containing protein [Symploca sp. SIO2B6]